MLKGGNGDGDTLVRCGKDSGSESCDDGGRGRKGLHVLLDWQWVRISLLLEGDEHYYKKESLVSIGNIAVVLNKTMLLFNVLVVLNANRKTRYLLG